MAKEIIVNAYPKSGITWLVHLLCDLLDSPQQDLPNSPKMYWGDNEDGNYIIRKTHSIYQPRFNNKTVIFLQRDPRDIAVSRMYYNSCRFNIRQSMAALWTTGKNKYTYDNWLSSWFNRPNVYYTKYELLHSQPYKELSAIYHFITGSSVLNDKIKRVLENQSLENMRLQIDDHFVRKGIVGDWRNHFSEDDIKVFEDNLGDFMRTQGYD